MRAPQTPPHNLPKRSRKRELTTAVVRGPRPLAPSAKTCSVRPAKRWEVGTREEAAARAPWGGGGRVPRAHHRVIRLARRRNPARETPHWSSTRSEEHRGPTLCQHDLELTSRSGGCARSRVESPERRGGGNEINLCSRRPSLQELWVACLMGGGGRSLSRHYQVDALQRTWGRVLAAVERWWTGLGRILTLAPDRAFYGVAVHPAR